MKRGVDFDGTMSLYDGYKGPDVCGDPIGAMIDRIKGWLADGDEVVVLTARVHPSGEATDVQAAYETIRAFCVENLGQELEVTCMKDPMMVEIWDDRAVRVDENTGLISDQADIIAKDIESDADGIGEFLDRKGP
jgi:hypothetical protein